MAPRSYWQGHLQLELLNAAVKLYPASSKSDRVVFNMVNRDTGNRLKQLYVDSETHEPVETENRGRGYQVAKNDYIIIEDDDYESIKLEATKTIEITQFVDIKDIDHRYFEVPYFIVPSDKVGQVPFAIIRETMREKGLCALASVVVSKRERTILLIPHDKGLVGIILRFHYEVRSEDGYFDDIPDIAISPEWKKIAGQLIDAKTATFVPEKVVDRYEEGVVEMIRLKQAGHVLKPQPEQPRPNSYGVSILDLLALSQAQAERRKKEEAKSETQASTHSKTDMTPSAAKKAQKKTNSNKRGKATELHA